jgi:hypothetical protein
VIADYTRHAFDYFVFDRLRLDLGVLSATARLVSSNSFGNPAWLNTGPSVAAILRQFSGSSDSSQPTLRDGWPFYHLRVERMFGCGVGDLQGWRVGPLSLKRSLAEKR